MCTPIQQIPFSRITNGSAETGAAVIILDNWAIRESPLRGDQPLNCGSQVRLTPRRLKVFSSTLERITVE